MAGLATFAFVAFWMGCIGLSIFTVVTTVNEAERDYQRAQARLNRIGRGSRRF